VDSALRSGEVTMDRCFSESMKSLLKGCTANEQPGRILDEGGNVDNDGGLIDAIVDLLKTVIALPEKYTNIWETFEVGMAVGGDHDRLETGG